MHLKLWLQPLSVYIVDFASRGESPNLSPDLMAEIVASKTLKFLKPEPRVTLIEFKFCLSKSLPKKLEIPELREDR